MLMTTKMIKNDSYFLTFKYNQINTQKIVVEAKINFFK